MSVNQKIRDELPEHSIVFSNPAYDNSIIGVDNIGQVIYDMDQMIIELSLDNNMTLDEAREFIEYNTIRMLDYMGAPKPIIRIDKIVK